MDDDKAATKIQAGFRGLQARRQVESLKNDSTSLEFMLNASRSDSTDLSGLNILLKNQGGKYTSTALSQFRPFALQNNAEAIVKVGCVDYFEQFENHDELLEVIKTEFGSKSAKALYYATASNPDDFANTIKPGMISDLSQLRDLERLVTHNRAVRVEEKQQAEVAAKLKAEKEAEAAAAKAAAKAARPEGEEDEEEPEEEEEKSPDGKKLTRKEREALERQQKAARKEEKERVKREYEQEVTLQGLQAKLVRFVEVVAFRIEFA